MKNTKEIKSGMSPNLLNTINLLAPYCKKCLKKAF